MKTILLKVGEQISFYSFLARKKIGAVVELIYWKNPTSNEVQYFIEEPSDISLKELIIEINFKEGGRQRTTAFDLKEAFKRQISRN